MNPTVQTTTTQIPESPIPDASLRCELVTDFGRLQELSRAWDSLASADARAEIFHTWNWARAVSAAYDDSLQLVIPAVYEGDRLLGILPLVRDGKTLRFLAGREADYNDILCAEPNAIRVIAAAFQALLSVEGWTSCVLDKLPARSRLLRHRSELPKPLRTRLQPVFLCPSSGVNLAHDRDEQIAKILRKQQLRRAQNKLERMGSLRFRHLESRSEIRNHLPRFFRQHISRHAMNGVQSHFLASRCRRFYGALVDELNPRTCLRFSVLELDGEPIAYHFGFQANGKFLFYQPTFDIRYWECCPGDALVRYLFRYAQESGVTDFDFSIGAEHYKARYSNYEADNCVLYFDRAPRSPSGLFRRGVRRAIEFARLRPKLAQEARSVRSKLKLALLRGRRIATHGGAQEVVRRLAALASNTLYRRRAMTVMAASAAATPAALPLTASKFSNPGLDELAMLSLDYPECITEARLNESRRRLKQGDRVHVCRDDNRAHVFWIAERSELQLAKECAVPLGSSALLVYDWWNVPCSTGSQRVDPDFLRALVAEHSGRELWVCSPDEAADDFLKAGFVPKYKLQAVSFLHRIRRIRGLLPCDPEAGRSC